MAILCALGQHGELVAMQARLGVGEYVFAHLDDIHTVTVPARVDVAHVVVEEPCPHPLAKRKSGTEWAQSRVVWRP